MSYLPCLNPSCKSYGISHPNCRCWAQAKMPFAEGGEAKSFCSEDRMHNSDCEHFVDGGSVGFDDLPEDSAQSQSFDNLPEDKAPPGFDDLPDDSAGILNTAKAGVEGLERGLTGGLSDVWRTKVEPKFLPESMQTTPEELLANQENSPIASGAGEMLGKGAQFALTNAALPGSGYLKAALAGGLLQGENEISKGLLGQGDPTNPYASAAVNIGAATLLGPIAEGAFNLAGKMGASALQKLANTGMAEKAGDFLRGIGDAANSGTADEIKNIIAEKGSQMSSSYKSGLNAFENLVPKLTKWGTDMAGGILSHKLNLSNGESAVVPFAIDKLMGPQIEKIIGRPVSGAAKYATAAAMRALSENAPEAIPGAINYARHIAQGSKNISDGIDGLFGGLGSVTANLADPDMRDKLKDIIAGGGVNTQMQNQINADKMRPPAAFAEGGEVVQKDPNVSQEPDHFARAFPEQSMLLSAARGRISGYLNSVRPQKDLPKLAFDHHFDDPEAERKYDRAIDIANKPLSVLEHMKNGTLLPEHVGHLTSMYPEVKSHLDKKLTERIMKAQLAKEKPSYKVRQGMSMFMGTPLSGEMTPAALQAAQAVFTQKQTPQQSPAPGKNKKGTAGLSKSADNSWTGDQASEKRQISER